MMQRHVKQCYRSVWKTRFPLLSSKRFSHAHTHVLIKSLWTVVITHTRMSLMDAAAFMFAHTFARNPYTSREQITLYVTTTRTRKSAFTPLLSSLPLSITTAHVCACICSFFMTHVQMNTHGFFTEHKFCYRSEIGDFPQTFAREFGKKLMF